MFWRKEGGLQAILFCILINGLTNPTLNLILTHSEINVLILEAAVVIVEMLAALLIFKARIQKAFLFSLIANGFSYGLGLVLFEIGWL